MDFGPKMPTASRIGPTACAIKAPAEPAPRTRAHPAGGFFSEGKHRTSVDVTDAGTKLCLKTLGTPQYAVLTRSGKISDN